MATAKAMEALDQELAKPLPGRRRKVDQSEVADEMRIFHQAAGVAATAQGR